MDDVFQIQGRVVDKAEIPYDNLRMAIVDRDLFSDDLIAVGTTDNNGEFRLSFTTKEFNQEPLEHEKSPEMYIVFSIRGQGKPRTVAKVNFFHRRFNPGFHDLGTIKLPFSKEAPVFLEEKPTPGYKKDIVRLNIDDPLVWYCLEEMAPRIEEVTQWKNLLQGLDIERVKNFNDFVPILSMLLLVELSKQALENISYFLNQSVLALYDPFRKTMLINVPRCRKNNLDAFKVILGHELVHVGQFKYLPGLTAQFKQQCTAFLNQGKALDFDGPKVFNAFKQSPFHHTLVKLEGYATLIENEHLRKEYNCATFFEQYSLMDVVLARLFEDVFRDAAELSRSKVLNFDQWLQFFSKKERHLGFV